MGLRERLQSAEYQGREAARQGFTRVRSSADEAQSRIRRNMRIRPRTAKPGLPLKISLAHGSKAESEGQPIVSVNGQDLSPEKTEAHEEQVA
jgi:hypothetical protein